MSAAALPIPDQLVALACELRQAVEARAKEPHPKSLYPILNLAWHLFGRLGRHLGYLLDKFRAGTLAPPRRRAGTTRQSPATPAKPRLREPSRPGWLLPAMGYRGLLCTDRLAALLADPGLPGYLETAPQTGRFIRPMCRALAVPLPEFLKPPPRPKRQRKQKEPLTLTLSRKGRGDSEKPSPLAGLGREADQGWVRGAAASSEPAAPPPQSPPNPPPPDPPKPYTGDYSHLAGPTDPGFLDRLKRAEERRRRRLSFRPL